MKSVLFGLILFYAVVAAAWPQNVSASNEWSWAHGYPWFQGMRRTEEREHSDCPTYQRMGRVKGRVDQELCLFTGEDLRFATFLEDGSVPRAAVAFALDDEFHVLEGVCGNPGGCVYSPESDALVMRYLAEPTYASAFVYKKVKERIRVEFDVATGYARYVFDASHPDIELQEPGGRALAVGGVAISRNGSWAAVELQNLGLAVIEVETGIIRRVTDRGPQYGLGLDPKMELAISSDGLTIFSMGSRIGLNIARVEPGCGEPFKAAMQWQFDSSVMPCPHEPVDIARWAPLFSKGSNPIFDEAGGEIDFLVTLRDGRRYRASYRAADYDPPRMDYLALGDSFSSGEGETDDSYYIEGTNTSTEKCHTSRRAYPFLFARLVGLSPDGVRSVACSGAKIIDVLGAASYFGQGARLDTSSAKVAQADALQTFYPGRIAQSLFVALKKPLMVTIGIGGNDAAFMDKLKTCAMPGTCEWVASVERLRQVGREIAVLGQRLGVMYEHLKRDSPTTNFVAVGYPKVVQTHGRCDFMTDLLLNEQERQFMDQGIEAINSVIRYAAYAAHILYVDIESSLAGHELCSGAATAAVNGLRLGDDISLSFLPMLKIIGAESFHPTPFGHELIAGKLAEDHPYMWTEVCGDECAQSEPSPLGLSQYWPNFDGAPLEARLQRMDFLKSRQQGFLSREITIEVGSKTFKPDTPVMVKGDQTMELNEVVVADNAGGLRGSVELPRLVQPGYYTVHLVGKSYSGEPVDVYQVFAYEGERIASVGEEGVGAARFLTAFDPVVVNTAGEEALGRAAVLGEQNVGRDKKDVSFSGLIALGIAALSLFVMLCILWKMKHSQDRGG